MLDSSGAAVPHEIHDGYDLAMDFYADAGSLDFAQNSLDKLREVDGVVFAAFVHIVEGHPVMQATSGESPWTDNPRGSLFELGLRRGDVRSDDFAVVYAYDSRADDWEIEDAATATLDSLEAVFVPCQRASETAEFRA